MSGRNALTGPLIVPSGPSQESGDPFYRLRDVGQLKGQTALYKAFETLEKLMTDGSPEMSFDDARTKIIKIEPTLETYFSEKLNVTMVFALAGNKGLVFNHLLKQGTLKFDKEYFDRNPKPSIDTYVSL